MHTVRASLRSNSSDGILRVAQRHQLRPHHHSQSGKNEISTESPLITIIRLWISHMNQHGNRDALTGLEFDTSGQTFSLTRPTLVAHRSHGTVIGTSNMCVQAWGTNLFLRSDRIARISFEVDSSRGAVATLLRRMGRHGLVTVDESDIMRMVRRKEVLSKKNIEALRQNGLSRVERGWLEQ